MNQKLLKLLNYLRKSRLSKIFFVVVMSYSAACLLKSFGALTTFENKLLDARFLYASHPELADTNIVMIAIDQNSIDIFEQQLQIGYPWPRQYYGLIVEYLKNAGARTISFDIIFSSPDINRLELDGQESDEFFANSIQTSGNVLLGVHLMPMDEGAAGAGRLRENHFVTGNFSRLYIPKFQRVTAPLDTFQSVAARLGVFNFSSDEDGICRRTPLIYQWGTTLLPHFSLATMAIGKDIEIKVSENKTDLQSICRFIPMDEKGNLLIYWYGRGGPNGVFKYYSFEGVMSSAIQMMEGKEPVLPPELFKDKYVIVGASAAGLMDFKSTPFTHLEEYPGMEIHATILSNLRNEHYIRMSPEEWSFIIALLMVSGVALLFFYVKRIPIAIASIVLLVVCYILFSFWQFYDARLWIPIAFPFISAFLSLMAAAVVSYATEGQQKQELRRAFNRYLSPQVIDQIIKNPDTLELGGTEIEATVFFSDIAGFTSISEKLSPRELIQFLNEYLSIGSDIILARDAMIDKFIGDAIMALFGAPIPKEGHAANACLTALEIQEKMVSFYASKPADMPHFETRIGLNTGRLVLGNVGSKNRLDFTAIGDTVNLAARLEGANKVYGTNILISEFTYQQAKASIEVRELDLIKVKGKEVPIRIYEVLAKKGELKPDMAQRVIRFHETLELYRKKEFLKARQGFETILRDFPNDGPSKTYFERCIELQYITLPENWDGVYALKVK